MKVYACPEELKVFEPDYRNYENQEKMRKVEEKYYRELTIYLQALGYRGKYTGKQIHFHVADSHALYVVADKGNSMVLFHSPLFDAYYAHPILLRGLRRADVVKMVERDEAWIKRFPSQKA